MKLLAYYLAGFLIPFFVYEVRELVLMALAWDRFEEESADDVDWLSEFRYGSAHAA